MTRASTDSPSRGFQVLAASIFLLVVVSPITDRLAPGTDATLFFRVAVFLAAAWSISPSWSVRATMLVLAIGTVTGPVGFLEASLGWGLVAGRICELLFYVAMIAIVMARLFSEVGVSRDTLFGAASNYLLIGLAFGQAYLLLETFQPGSFNFPDWARAEEYDRGLVYFSFVTLTTLGFGDVTPLTDRGASLVMLEAIIGILYPTVVIARIVSLYSAGGGVAPFEARRRSVPLHKRVGQFEALLLLLVLQLATFPYVSYLLTRILGLLTLAAAVYALRGNRNLLIIGVTLGALATLDWGGAAATSVAGILGTGFQTAFYLFAAVVFGWQVLRRERVDREVILGVCCVYLLLGAAWAGAYQLVFAFDPESFNMLRADTARDLYLDMLYLSYVTLTTLGYGDILPLGGASNSLVTIEAVVGILFPSIIIARLVAQYRSEPVTRPESPL